MPPPPLLHASVRTSTLFFFFNHTATTETYTLSLHDALPIFHFRQQEPAPCPPQKQSFGSASSNARPPPARGPNARDRKSTRLNSSHVEISYAVFCLKKKKKIRDATLALWMHCCRLSSLRCAE